MRHEYRIIESDYSGVLGVAVTAALADGWELWGNPFAFVFPSLNITPQFCQALVRPIEEEHGGLRMAEKPAGYTVHTPETSEFGTSPVITTNWPQYSEALCACENGNGDNPDCPVHFGNNLVS